MESGSDPSPEPELADDSTFRTVTWEDWPIVIDGVNVTDINNYKFEIAPGIDIELDDFSDVVTRWHYFRPCDEPLKTDEENALKSFFYDHANAGWQFIHAARNKGLRVIMPLPFIGTPAPQWHCNGEVYDAPDPDQLWNAAETIQIPVVPPGVTGGYGLAKNIITPAFTSYWAAKAAYYIEAIDAYDINDDVWRWRVIEELRPSIANEYAFALAVRDTVNTHDGTRRMVEYSAGHYLPNADIMYALLEQGPGSTTEETFSLNPTDPVARLANAGMVDDLYPDDITVERNAAYHLTELFDDVLTGAYTGRYLKDDGHVNRIHPYHRIRLGREVLENIEDVYSTNSTAESISQDPPDHILFHAPDLTADGPLYMSADEARHDFWAGIHEAKGVWIYAMGYRDDSVAHAAVWEQYVRALSLIKSEMRPFLAAGVKTTPSLTHDGTDTVIASDAYMADFPNSSFLALPDSPDEYLVINHTLFRTGDLGYLIVTNSLDQGAVEFNVEFPDCINTATIRSGSSANLSTLGDTLTDTFDGIDGRVYKITFETCP